MKKAIDIYYNRQDKRYYLVEIEYNIEDGSASILPLKELADSLALALYKVEELFGSREQQLIQERG